MNQPSAYVIILNFNGSRWLAACLESLRATDYANFKILLVDNASTDDGVEIVRQNFSEIEIILNQTNLGFSEGNNVAIRAAIAAGADYVLLLNPDTKVTPQWLSELIAVGERERDIGILGAVQLAYDSEEFNSWTAMALAPFLAELKSANAREWISVEWVEGACFAIKREVIEAVGLLDPIYFAFYEEIDFCRRAACGGYKTAVVSRSRIHHFRGGSWEATPAIKRERDYRCDRSQFIFALTDPRRSLAANVGWYLITLGTKAKDAAREFSLTKAWNLLRIQFDLLGNWRRILGKWRRERTSLKPDNARKS